MPPILLFALLFAPQEKPPERCAVSGTVVDSVTEKPVAKVQVRLHLAEQSVTHTAVTRTESDGHFSLVDLDPGVYELVAERPGYLDTTYRGILRLDAGRTLDGIQLKIVPGAVLSGRVVDPDGEPVGAARVVLAARSVRKGRFLMQSVDNVDADEEGMFRFAGLSAGKYYVLVEGPHSTWDRVDHSPRSAAPREALIPTFYPGAPDLASASPIDVRSGEHRDGVEIRTLRRRVFRLAGRVVNPPVGRVQVSLRPLDVEPLRGDPVRTSTRNGLGDFEFRDVAPGAYWLESLGSRQRVDVGFADLDGVRLTVVPPAEVRVSVKAEGPQQPTSLAVSLAMTDGNNAYFETAADGHATRRVAAGRQDVYVLLVPKGHYVKSIRSGERDVLLDGLDVPPSGAVPLEIVLAADGGTVEGGVAERAGAVTVALIPRNRARADLYLTAPIDQYGRFIFEEVPPGAYKAFAWDEVKEGDWFESEFLKRYESQGIDLQLDPRATKSLDLKIARDK